MGGVLRRLSELAERYQQLTGPRHQDVGPLPCVSALMWTSGSSLGRRVRGRWQFAKGEAHDEAGFPALPLTLHQEFGRWVSAATQLMLASIAEAASDEAAVGLEVPVWSRVLVLRAPARFYRFWPSCPFFALGYRGRAEPGEIC